MNISYVNEELDQFNGDAEIRNVLQSTMRGGDLFWVFRSFNPPISIDNWANEYALESEADEDTLVISNTYLDVPEKWLGKQFIKEAEKLKKKNPRAYEHEYLGIPTGTGGGVFPNACDLDMNQLVDTWDGTRDVKVPMWQTFDKIYNGIDWGFANDPFRFVRMHLDVKKLDLYIFAEYSTVQTRNIVVFEEIYDKLKLCDKNELVTADSAELKSIGDFKAYGAFIRGAQKGPESVRYGIKWLQGLNHIYIDRRKCPLTYKEFTHYEYEVDKDGKFISDYPDKDNHSIDACLPYDAEIYTPNGFIKIGDMVGTEGKIYAYNINSIVEADYIHCRLTHENADIYEIELEDGRVVECTYNHKILTSNRGYVMAGELTTEDDVVCAY